jgi:yecA family protein
MVMSLAAFLSDPKRPQGTLSYHELQGFLFVIASAPELIVPSEWMPQVFADQDAGYRDQAEAETVVGELMALYNDINAGVAAEAAVLPADCEFLADVLANLEPDAPVSQWSRGFAQAHGWLEETWDEYVPDEHDDEFGMMVLALSFFSSRRLAEAYRKEVKSKQSLEAMATMVRDVFPDVLEDYAQLGRTIAAFVSQDDESQG